MSDPQSAVDSFNQYLCDYYVPGTVLITGSETVIEDISASMELTVKLRMQTLSK